MWTNMDDLRPTDRLLARGSWLISEFGGKYLGRAFWDGLIGVLAVRCGLVCD